MYFEKPVDLRSRDAMASFLARHYRYHTMNSWNRSTSYAHCIKIGRLGLNSTQAKRAYEMLETDFWDAIRFPIDDFTLEFAGRYTIGTNGRSGGYLVLYNSARELTGHQSYCRSCGQRNFKRVHEADKDGTTGNRCGRCHAEGETGRVNYTVMPNRLNIYPCRSIDQGENFDGWSMDDLRNRVKLVRAFDRTCDGIRSAFIDLAENCEVVDEVVMVPQHRKVLSCTMSA
jgi:hypothetical protein